MKPLVALLLVLTLCTPLHAQGHPGRVTWGVVLGSVATYEIWAVSTHHETMSQSVQHGPRWFKVSVAVGLGALSVHVFLEKP